MKSDGYILAMLTVAGVRARSTLGYLPMHDHRRLPGRFHARLTGVDGSRQA